MYITAFFAALALLSGNPRGQTFPEASVPRIDTGASITWITEGEFASDPHFVATALDASAKDPVKKARRTAERQQELEERVAWMKETRMELVISQEQGDVEYFKKFGIDIKPYKRDVAGKELEKDFKKAQNPFRVAFVCAMWLTGFDVPSLGTLYLDKPLKAHTLMQAIARANRVFEGKRNGVIVDYIGLIDALKTRN